MFSSYLQFAEELNSEPLINKMSRVGWWARPPWLFRTICGRNWELKVYGCSGRNGFDWGDGWPRCRHASGASWCYMMFIVSPHFHRYPWWSSKNARSGVCRMPCTLKEEDMLRFLFKGTNHLLLFILILVETHR